MLTFDWWEGEKHVRAAVDAREVVAAIDYKDGSLLSLKSTEKIYVGLDLDEVVASLAVARGESEADLEDGLD